MKTQEAIKAIEVVRNVILKDPSWLKSFVDKVNEASDMAMDALKKQIPVKPVKSKDPRYGMGYVYHDWVCPSCGKFLAYEPEESGCHHCKCGQAIDWEV